MPDKATQAAADDLVEALRLLDVRAKAMFEGYCFYVDHQQVAGQFGTPPVHWDAPVALSFGK